MRAIARYPVSWQYARMLEDDHEWCVLADARLKILVAKRGGRDSVSTEVIRDAYETLIKKIPPGTTIRIYDLHTHPVSEGNVPSYQDIDAFIAQKYHEGNGFILAGHGVISDKGILIVKLTNDKEKLKSMYKTVKTKYRKETRNYIKKALGETTWKGVGRHALETNMGDKEQAQMMTRAHKSTFHNVIKKEPDISARVVRKRMEGKKVRR